MLIWSRLFLFFLMPWAQVGFEIFTSYDHFLCNILGGATICNGLLNILVMICKSPLKGHTGSKWCLAGFTDDLLNLFELAWPKGKKVINRTLTVVSYGAIRYQYKLSSRKCEIVSTFILTVYVYLTSISLILTWSLRDSASVLVKS